MTVIPVRSLTRHDIRQLGNDLDFKVRHDRRMVRPAINRSLAGHGEAIGCDDDVRAAMSSEAVAS